MLYDLYQKGEISFEAYTKLLMGRLDAAIKAAEKYLLELEAKCTK